MAGTSNYTNILAQIKTYLLTVTGIGNVHDYNRNFKNITDFNSGFKSSTADVICGWWISRERSAETGQEEIGYNQRRHTFVIRGIYSYDDASASEKTFQALVESVCDVFRDVHTMNGTAFDSSPVNVDLVDIRMIGKGDGEVMCHYAELRIDVVEILLNTT